MSNLIPESSGVTEKKLWNASDRIAMSRPKFGRQVSSFIVLEPPWSALSSQACAPVPVTNVGRTRHIITALWMAALLASGAVAVSGETEVELRCVTGEAGK